MKHADGIRCIGYARSAVGSVDGQVELIRKHCRKFELVDVVCEPGRSGGDFDRPELKKLLQMISRGGIDVVVVTRLTVLARSAGFLHCLFHEFDRHRVRLIALAEGIDTTSATGKAEFEAIRSIARKYLADVEEERTV
ncbi:MAG: recombinase family protein [Planctomycetes bacterium]|nr:recombinase family protein [Planctomycetota bacterium]